MSFPPVARTAFVTGCSSGIGLATAALLQARGWRVLASARQPADLAMLATRGFDAIEMDLTQSASVQRAVARVLEITGGTLGALVNNAGAGQPGAWEDLSRDALREQFEVNVFGLHELTRAFIPVFRRAQAGRIVNVSSVLGRVTMPFMGAYCASKHALESLSDALRVELADTGIAVAIVEPGPIITAFRANAQNRVAKHVDTAHSRFGGMMARDLERRRNSQKRPGFINKPPEAVGARIVHALESPRPRRRYCVSPVAHLGAWLRRLAPDALMDAVLVRRLRRLQRASPDSPPAARGHG